jgi:hypothetical protein
LRGWRSQEREGSSPFFRTTFKINNLQDFKVTRNGGLCCHVVKFVVKMKEVEAEGELSVSRDIFRVRN